MCEYLEKWAMEKDQISIVQDMVASLIESKLKVVDEPNT